MRHLPILTIGILLTGILAWNLSFYGDLYRVQASQRAVGVQEPLPRLLPVTPVGQVEGVQLAGGINHSIEQATSATALSAGPEPEAAVGHRSGAARQALDGEPGAVLQHHPEGHARSAGGTLRGHRHGRWTEFFESGAVLMTGSYEQGTRVGEWAFHHADGSLRSQGLYVAGLRDGVWRCFHPGGMGLRSEGRHCAREGGERVGVWTRYFTNGAIMERGSYQRGVMQGQWVFYDREGREGPRTGLYRDGALVED